MTTKRKVFVSILAASPFCLFALWAYCHLECYCVFWPGIDTRFAPGYSESAFDSLTVGMTAEDVQQKLGTPLFTHTNRDGAIQWGYTDDGKCIVGDWKLADFAWLGREVTFRDGTVTQVHKQVYCD